jgi:hypothetical protein
MSSDDCNCSAKLTYGVGILGSLLVVSEILGVITHIKPNSIIHFVFLTMKHLLKKTKVDTITVIESLEEALIDEKKEEEDLAEATKIKINSQ